MTGKVLVAGSSTTSRLFFYETSGFKLCVDTNPMPAGFNPGTNVQALAFSPSEAHLAVGASTLTVYDTATWLPIPLPSGIGTVRGCKFSPDGTKLAVAHSSAPQIDVLNTTGGTWSKILFTPALPGAGYSCDFSPDGALLAVGHASAPYLTVFNVSDWSKVYLTWGEPPGTGQGVAFSPNGALLAVAHSTSPYLTIYNTSDWSKVTITGGNPGGTANECAFSPDGTLLAVSHSGGSYATVYNTSTWAKVTLTGGNPEATTTCCAFSDDGAHLAFSRSGAVVVYDVATWTRRYLEDGDTGSVAFSSTALAKQISGTVTGDDGNPAERVVRFHNRSTGTLIHETLSVDGEYSASFISSNEIQRIVLDDVTGTLHNDILDRVIPA